MRAMELTDTVSATYCYFAMHSASYSVEAQTPPSTESTEEKVVRIEWVSASSNAAV